MNVLYKTISTKLSKKDIKHVSATFFEDNAIEVELLQNQLFRANRAYSSKKMKDQAFIELAYQALLFCIEQCKSEGLTKYPTHEHIQSFLENAKI